MGKKGQKHHQKRFEGQKEDRKKKSKEEALVVLLGRDEDEDENEEEAELARPTQLGSRLGSRLARYSNLKGNSNSSELLHRQRAEPIFRRATKLF